MKQPFYIISKKTFVQDTEKGKSKEVDTYIVDSEYDVSWTYLRSGAKRFFNPRQAYNFLIQHKLEGKTIEEVKWWKENNIDWRGVK